MDTAAGLRHGNALDAMTSRLILEARPGSAALHDKADLFDPAELCFAEIDDLELPAAPLSIERIHAVQIRCEEHTLLAADAAADLHDDVFGIVWVLREKQDADLLLEARLFRLAVQELLLGELAHLGILHQLCGGSQLRADALVGGVRLGQRLQLARLPLDAGIERRIRIGRRLLETAAQLLILLCNELQSFKHGSLPKHLCIKCTTFGGKKKEAEGISYRDVKLPPQRREF